MDEDMRNLVGRRIKFLRNQMGMSQETLSFNSELDRTYVSSIESGRRNVSILNLERLAVALGTNLAGFFDSKEFKLDKIYKKEDKSRLKVAEIRKLKNRYRYKYGKDYEFN